MEKKLYINNYRIRTTLDDDTTNRLALEILDESYSVIKNFRDNEKCLVTKFTTDHVPGTFILKVPKARFSRYWERFLTLFREGEPLRQFSNMIKLRELGFRGPAPVMAAEKRCDGYVCDGFIVYEYIDGRQATPDDAHIIAPELIKLLKLGYIRKDPHPRNFILKNDEIYFIDFNIKKPLFFNKIRCMMEFCKFLERAPEGASYKSNLIDSNAGFLIAKYIQQLVSSFRKTRRKIKMSFTSKG